MVFSSISCRIYRPVTAGAAVVTGYRAKLRGGGSGLAMGGGRRHPVSRAATTRPRRRLQKAARCRFCGTRCRGGSLLHADGSNRRRSKVADTPIVLSIWGFTTCSVFRAVFLHY